MLCTAMKAAKSKPYRAALDRGCSAARYVNSFWCIYTDKKENQIFLIYKEIQNAVAKSYMRKSFLHDI
jgi:hypothetical protein